MIETDEFKQLKIAWDSAEKYLKIAEQVSDYAVIPGINELRYAGRKVLEASVSDENTAKQILSDARMDCYRAQHDSIDVSVSIINTSTALMIKKFGYDRIVAVLPDLTNFIEDITIAQEKIANSREKRNNRFDVYDDIKDVDLPNLRKRYRALLAAEPSMSKKLKWSRYKEFLGYLIGVIGIITAIVIAILD